MALEWGSFANSGIKELVEAADPTLKISQQPVSARYELGEEIGVGSYGRAMLATRLEDGLQVVCKQIRLFEMDEKARVDTLTEAKVLAQFNHVNIVHYHECLLEGGVLNIVMEYANGGDLAAAIQGRQREKKPYTEDEIMFWFVQIVLAMYHVHGKNVLHRDLKSQNIFIAEGNLLKLGDFGIARVLNSDTELARTVIGSPYYLSPEICEDRPYNRKSDVWSLGCVLYELATLRRAFDGQSLPALVVKILRGKYPPVPTKYSSQLRGLIESMLKQNPKDRPTADVILRSDFVRHHVERYAAHVVALGLWGGTAAEAKGSGAAAAAAAALGLAELAAANTRPKHSLPSRAPRPAAARPPRAPPVSGLPSVGSGPPASPSPSPPPAAAAEAERSSSRDVSETDTSSSTPAEGSSPTKTAAAKVGQRGLIETGWVRKQHAALAEMAGMLAAQKAGGGAAAAAQAALASVVAGDAGCAIDSTLPSAGLSAGGIGGTATKAKLAELKLQRDTELEAQRKANAVAREQKKVAAARRTHEAAVAVRSRTQERQKEMERNLAEQKAEMEAKARKAIELAAAIRIREEVRKKELQEVAQHMSAHKEQVRAAKAKINKEQLSELGAQFAARLASGGGEASEAAAGQVLVVDFGSGSSQPAQPSTSSAKASPAHHRQRSPAGPRSSAAAPVGRGAGAQSPSPSPIARGPRAAAGSDSDGAGPSGRGAKAAAEPPWKQRHKPAKGEFPAVQIFTPFGSGVEAAATGGDDGGDDEQEQQAAAGVLEVLAQIHTVLGVEGEGSSDGGGGAPAGGGGRGGVGRARPLSPAPDDDDGGGSGAGPAAAAANGLKVEQLRIDLERQLGGGAFLAAYRCLRDMQGEEAEAEDRSDGATQRELERVLGKQLHLARVVHKLITLEDAVFA